MCKKICFVIVVFILMSSLNISAQTGDVSTSPVPESEYTDIDTFNFKTENRFPEPDLKKYLLRVMVILMLIICGIVGVIWILKIFLQDKKNLFNKKERYFEVIDRVYLDSKKGIYLIKIIDEILVVGASSDGLNLLSKITDSQKVEALVGKDFMPLLNLFNKKISEREKNA